LAIDPHYVYALNNKCLALGKLGNYTGAIQFYDKALAKQPNDTNALTHKGVALYDLGNYHDAVVSYDKALALNPNYVEALNNKANVLGNLGKRSIQYYQRAIKLIQSNQTSRLSFTPGAKSIYLFISEDASNTQLIRAVDLGDNEQSQKIITIKMNLAEQYTSINDFHLAITTYRNHTGIIRIMDAHYLDGQTLIRNQDNLI
jgi:tetratricopeptide (TPR) repeat protein